MNALLADAAKLFKRAAVAPGIPDRAVYGDPLRFQPGQLLDFLVSQHDAIRAGRHQDVRLGDQQGLHSWATRKGLPAPGQRHALFEQPLHEHSQLGFEGEIPKGQYGAGKVQQLQKGKILVTKVTPQAIHFSTASGRYPERFVLLKPQAWGQRDWLLMNTTPTEKLPYTKVHYAKLPAEKVEGYLRQMREGDTASAKVDGASSLIKLLKGGIEVASYRTSKSTGRPILHTERIFHGKTPKLDVPKHLVGSVLKGETYAQQGEKVLPPQELGGILNASLENALQAQQDKGIRLRNMVYDVQQYGKTPIDAHAVPYEERQRQLAEILPVLPKDVFHGADVATGPEAASQLWARIRAGKHPLTSEGIVIQPRQGRPTKAKLLEDADVVIRNVFPGEGKYRGTHAGGFEYSLPGKEPIVGRVGTGLSDALRRELWENSKDYLGRTARIRSQQQFGSGAYRAPALIALHEDI